MCEIESEFGTYSAHDCRPPVLMQMYFVLQQNHENLPLECNSLITASCVTVIHVICLLITHRGLHYLHIFQLNSMFNFPARELLKDILRATTLLDNL